TASASPRSPDPGGSSRQSPAPLGARLFGAKAPPEGGGSGAGGEAGSLASRGALLGGRPIDEESRLSKCRDGGIPFRHRHAKVVLHRSQPANSSGTYGDRNGHRHRS